MVQRGARLFPALWTRLSGHVQNSFGHEDTGRLMLINQVTILKYYIIIRFKKLSVE